MNVVVARDNRFCHDMRQLVIFVLLVAMIVFADCQHLECVDCPNGSILLSPLSYNTVRSNVFNGTQPSNEGCTNGASIDGQVTVDCGQGTTLIDCDRGYNNDANYSNLSSYFIWKRTDSVAAQVSVVFRLYQKNNISRITMVFWNSPSNSIIVPSVKIQFATDHNLQFTEIPISTKSPNRTIDGRSIVNIGINNAKLKFLYLKIIMTFYGDSKWIFLSEVQLCGNTASFQIVQPPTDDYVQIVSPIARMIILKCSLNVTIPNVYVSWSHNGSSIGQIEWQSSKTTNHTIRNFQPSDVGDYSCVFSDVLGSGWELRRNFKVDVIRITQLSPDHKIKGVDDYIQLTCSLNSNIPSNVTIEWIHNNNAVAMIPSNKSVKSNETATTLLMEDLQPTDAGVYECVFNHTVDGWILRRTINLDITVLVSVVASITTSTAVTTTAAVTTTTAVTTSTAVTTTATNTFIFTNNTTIVTSTTANATVTAINDTITAFTSISTRTNISITSVSTSIVVSTTPTTESSSIITTTTPSSTISLNPSGSTDSSRSDSVGAIVACVIVVILLVAGIVTLLVIAFIWRRNKKKYDSFDENNKKPPLSVTGLSILDKDEPTASDNQKQNLELESRPLIDLNYRPGSSPEMLMQSQEQSMSLINPNYQEKKRSESPVACGPPEFNPANPRDSVASSDNQVFTEYINIPAFLCGKSQDSKCDDTPTTCTSIYADPLPLVKTKGPPVVSFDNIKEIRELGTGLFGTVILANTVGLSDQYLGIGYSNDTTMSKLVAVKLLKSSASAEVKKAFDKEIKFMSRLKDDNVIRLLGISTTGTPFIMMEYMENGDLNGYLRQKKFNNDSEKPPAANEVTLIALVHISHQIAKGMKYLSSCKFIHRDLASRNILVGVNNAIKIADFGMSQNLYSAYYCRVGGRSVLPIRWMAYECFFGKFSVQTDVWAFGITLWEVFTLCRHLPYDDLTNQQMVEDAIKGANRKIPGQPENCPDDIYCIIKSCLQHDPSKRADFKALCDQLDQYYANLL